MRKLVGIVFGLLLVGLVGGAVAGAQAKVGVVDLVTVIDESDAGIEANARLSEFVDERQADLDALESQISALQQELNQSADSLGEADRTAKQEQIDQMISDYVNRLNAYEAQIQEFTQILQQTLLAEIRAVLQYYGDQNGYDLILDSNAVLYYRPVVDLTYDVIRTYNELRRQGAIQLIPAEATQ